MKFKKIFQKAAAVVMAAVTVFSVLPATTAFAAVGDVGTISFSHTYDGNGNAMRYNSSANINGYIAGGTGNYKYRMFVDGDTAFCLQPGVPLKTGNTLKEASSEAWNALSGSQKKAVGLGAKQKSIIDRCTASVYRYYQQGNYMGTPPTLQDFREELLKQNEPEAQEIALAIELFTDGSLNTFAKHTNVDTKSRLICYDILDLGKQLQPIGMLVVLDSILNRITQNRAKGRNTFIFIDEIYLLFQHEYSANFLFTLWKRVRKYGAYCTGITQNVDDLLQSHTARTMLANSEFIIMLNQASTDRLELAKLLNISDLQMSYITNVGAGQGLLKVGSSLVPFVNQFPRNTELYRLMTTKFGEV